MRRGVFFAGSVVWCAQLAAAPAGSQLTVEAMGEGFGPVVVTTRSGRVNWTAGRIVAASTAAAGGRGKADVAKARSAARQAAGHQAILLMQGIDAGPVGQFGDAVRGGLTVEGALRDYRGLTVSFDAETRTATAALRIPIHGPRGMVAMRHVILGLPLPRWKPPAAKPGAAKIDAIVIDARGTGFRPCVYPRLITSDGKAVFDGTHLRRDDPTRRNRPLYVTCRKTPAAPTTKPGLESRQVGTKGREVVSLPRLPGLLPFGTPPKRAAVVRASALSERPAGLLLNEDDLRALSRHPGVRRLLDAGEVAIVVDPAARKKQPAQR